MEIKHTHKQTQTYSLCAEEWPIPIKTRKNKDKNRTWKINLRTSTKTTTKYNILPFPSFISNKTQHKRNANQAHTQTKTKTYILRRRMADPGKNKKRTKIKIEHGKLIFGPIQKQQQNITSYPSLLLLHTNPNTKETVIKYTYKQTQAYRLQKNGRSR
jgi:hypothetical protein